MLRKSKTFAFVIVLLLSFSTSSFAINAGLKAPDITLLSSDGNTFTISSFKGQNTLLSFYAIFGDSSIETLKFLEYVTKINKNIKVLPVAIESKLSKVTELLKKNKITLPPIIDKNKEALDEYRILILPFTLLIDENGIIKKIYVDFDDSIREKILDDISKL